MFIRILVPVPPPFLSSDRPSEKKMESNGVHVKIHSFGIACDMMNEWQCDNVTTDMAHMTCLCIGYR